MGTVCPKCSHERQDQETAPDYQCPACGVIYAKVTSADALRQQIAVATRTRDWSGVPREHIPANKLGEAVASMPVSTAHTIHGRDIVRTVDVVTAECAFGMNIFRDLFSSVTDVVGGRSESTQKVLRDARRTALTELRKEAFMAGGNAVIGVDLDYSEFSGGGKSMLFVVASGTAVVLE